MSPASGELRERAVEICDNYWWVKAVDAATFIEKVKHYCADAGYSLDGASAETMAASSPETTAIKSLEPPYTPTSSIEIFNWEAGVTHTSSLRSASAALLQVNSHEGDEPIATPAEAALTVDAEQLSGAPTETGSIDPPSNVLTIDGDAADPAVALNLILLVQARVRGFLARRRIKWQV
eukprot:6138975-Prymnesium_polylepis.1